MNPLFISKEKIEGKFILPFILLGKNLTILFYNELLYPLIFKKIKFPLFKSFGMKATIIIMVSFVILIRGSTNIAFGIRSIGSLKD